MGDFERSRRRDMDDNRTDTINSEQFPWRGEQGSGSSWWWGAGQGSRIKMAGKQFVHRQVERI